MSAAEHTPALDGCRILEKLRSDALAELYRAEQVDVGRVVLVKVLRPGVLPSSPFAMSVEREAKLLSELDHPNVLGLYDFHRSDETMWLVLENVDGPALDTLLAERAPLPPAVSAAMGLQLCRALGHAHGRGVVHRDVQPRSVLVGTDGRLRLTGFAVATDERLPTAPELLDGATEFGSPQYMSPEQVLGEAPDPRSDLFSLGVVLYECLSGKRPFEGPDSRTVTQRIRHDAATPLARAAPDVPRALDTIVQRLLQKLPNDRFFDAGELDKALSDLLGEAAATPERVVRDFLAGSADEKDRRAVARVPPRRREPPLIGGLLACLALLLAGGLLIQIAAARRAGAANADGTRLPLAPARPAHLRVVATPWARVVVDGEHVETTPFARPIPLLPGRHFVRLEHPNAPTERRTIELSPTETLLLDVEMKVTGARPTASGRPPLPITSDPDTP